MSQNKNYIVKEVFNKERYNDEVAKIYYLDTPTVKHLRYPNETDIFNKSSKTTVCFFGALDSEVMYCENCKETHYNNMDYTIEHRCYNTIKHRDSEEENNIEKFEISNVICKKCGSTYNLEDVRIISRYQYNLDKSSRLVYDTIYNDNDDLVKYSIKSCTMAVERAFYFVDNSYKLIFNAKTGQTYLFNAPGNSKNKVKFINLKLPLNNITYNGKIFDEAYDKCLIDVENQEEYKLNVMKELYKNLYEKISKNLGYAPKSIEEYAKEMNITSEKEIYNIKNLALYNRFPNANVFFLNQISSYNLFYPTDRMKKVKNTNEDPLKAFLSAYKLNDKERFEKLYKETWCGKDTFHNLLYFSLLFKNEDYIYDLCKVENIFYELNDLNKSTKNNKSKESALFRFLRALLKVVDEESICKLIKTIKMKNLEYFASFYHNLTTIYPKLKLDFNKIYNMIKNIPLDLLKDDYFFSNRSLKGSENAKEIINYMFDELEKTLYELSKDKFSFKIKTLDEYYQEALILKPKLAKYDFTAFNFYKHNPTFNPYILTLMVKNGLGLNEYSDLNEGVYKYDFLNNIDEYSTDVLKDVFDYFGIPYVKSLRKYILSNPECFVALAYNSLIFKDVNMLKNILVPDKVKWLPIPYYFLESVVKVLKVDNNIDNLDSELDEFHRINKLKFLNHLVKTQGEEIAGNKLVNFYKVFEWENMLTDTANMFSTYTEIYGREYDDLTGSILQIHDRLVRFTGGNTPLKKVDFKLYKYSKEQLELEYEHNGYIFKLPKTGLEVATIGAELHNCVGTYRDKVRKNQCLIVLVEKDSKPKVCIEIFKGKVSEEYEIKQAKLDCNNPVYNDKEAFDAVMFWMKKNNIQSYNCYDLIAGNKRRVNVEQEIQELGAFEGELAIANDAIPF